MSFFPSTLLFALLIGRRSSAPSSTNTTLLPTLFLQCGHSGTFAKQAPPSSSPTCLCAGRFFDGSSISKHSMALLHLTVAAHDQNPFQSLQRIPAGLSKTGPVDQWKKINLVASRAVKEPAEETSAGGSATMVA